jgi:hypothetical protein
MKGQQLRIFGVCLIIVLAAGVLLGLAACSSKKTSTLSTSTNAPVLTTATVLKTSSTSVTTAKTTTTAAPLATTTAAFPYQGSGSGIWSGQITLNGKTYDINGTMTVAVDAGGNFSGTLTSSSGGSVNTTINAKVDSNGNLSGTVGFTINSTAFSTNWQGKMTASGSVLSMQGTWTSQYGSGTFSGSGTRSN